MRQVSEDDPVRKRDVVLSGQARINDDDHGLYIFLLLTLMVNKKDDREVSSRLYSFSVPPSSCMSANQSQILFVQEICIILPKPFANCNVE